MLGEWKGLPMPKPHDIWRHKQSGNKYEIRSVYLNKPKDDHVVIFHSVVDHNQKHMSLSNFRYEHEFEMAWG
jgi:hypothetical protein